MDILICGYGNIGKKTFNEIIGLIDQGHEIYTYDIKENKTQGNISFHFDYCFICVSTEMLEDGSCDTSNVWDCVDKVNADVIIIKSTVPPGTTDQIIEKYKDKNIVFFS